MFQDPKSFTPATPVARDNAKAAPQPAIDPTPEPQATPKPAPKPAEQKPTEQKPTAAAEQKPDPKPVPKPMPKPVDLKPVPAADPKPVPVAASKFVVPRQILGFDVGFITSRPRLIAACIAAALVAAIGFHLLASPRYRAVVQILISPTDLRILDKSLVQSAQTADTSVIQVESETRVLTSDKVLRRVVESEHLTDDPEFGGGASTVSRILAGVRGLMGLDVRPMPADELGALRTLQRVVSAKRTERTYVADLIVDSNDAQKSARIANAIAAAYVDEQLASRTEAARRVTESLSSRLSELKERVRRAEEAVELYKSQNNIVGAGGRLVHEQQLTDLTNQLGNAKVRTAEAKARYENSLQRGNNDAGSTSEAVQSNTIGRLREQHATAARQEATLSAELGPRHPFVIEARAQVRNAERQISDELSRIAAANRLDYERALANETSLSHSLDTLKQRAMDTNLAFVKLRELEREVEASRAVYESFLVRARETREQEKLDSANVRILSDAQPSRDRFWPPRLLILLLAGLIVGTLGGIGLAYAAEQLKRTSRPPELVAVPRQATR